VATDGQVLGAPTNCVQYINSLAEVAPPVSIVESKDATSFRLFRDAAAAFLFLVSGLTFEALVTSIEVIIYTREREREPAERCLKRRLRVL